MLKFVFLTLLFLSFSALADQGGDNSLDSAFSSTQTLTEQENKDAQNFIHQGKLQSSIDKNCKDNKVCDSTKVDEVGSVFGGTFGAAIEQNIGKLYSFLVGGMSMMGGNGGKVTVVSKDNERLKAIRSGESKESLKDVRKQEGEKKNDYCVYAAVGYEMISTYIHQSMQQKIQQTLSKDTSGEQAKALTALKMEHENRAKSSRYQSWIYGATTGCYIARAAASGGRLQMDPTYWAKMSAAGAISGLYIAKVKKHENAAKEIQKVIDDLPTAGACNPYTQTKCFCKEPTSKTIYADLYQQICVLQKGVAEMASPQVPCGVLRDGKMVVDQECKCKLSNSCFKGVVKISSPEVKFGSNIINDTNKAFDLLNNGNLNAGELDNYSARMAAAARKIASKAKIPTVPLTANQKKNADSLKGLNLPAGVAEMAAKAPQVNPPGLEMGSLPNSAISKLPKSIQEKLNDLDGPKFKSGSADQNVAETDESIELPKMGEESGNQEAVEVLNFAEAAVSKADVSNAPETPIFDIISNRYKRSGWNKLEPTDIK